METVKVYSPILDEHIQKNIIKSPIWKEAYQEEEEKPEKRMYVYHIKFNGTIPIQVTKIEK